MTQSLYNFTMNSIDGTPVPLSKLKGKVVLVVNVASKCGLTPQYDGLEKLYEKLNPRGFEILGFPANEFAGQEPGTNEDIHSFCRMSFGVKFPMFEKIIVKGDGQHPLYTYLTSTAPVTKMKKDGTLMALLQDRGLLSGGPSDIKWNFEKFLIGKDGKIIERFSPEIAPDDEDLIQQIEKALAA